MTRYFEAVALGIFGSYFILSWQLIFLELKLGSPSVSFLVNFFLMIYISVNRVKMLLLSPMVLSLNSSTFKLVSRYIIQSPVPVFA